MKISDKEVQIMEKQVSPLVAQAGKYIVESVEDVDKSSEFLKKVRDTEREIEAKRLEFTKPLNQSLKAINATFKQLKEPLVEARQVLTNKILDWKRAETARLEKEEARRRKIQESHVKRGHTVEAPVVLDRPEKTIGNTRTTKFWTFEVQDLGQIPREYMVIDNVAVRKAIREGVREIRGLKIYQDERLSIVGR